MICIHVVQRKIGYTIENMNFSDTAGLFLYLRAKGVTDANLRKTVEALVRQGTYTIRQE